MSETEHWDHLIDEAILNFLSEQGEADLDGLLHILKRARIRIDHDGLNKALARLSKEGRISIDLEAATHNPTVRLNRPFVGWT